jgi:hypothetical protein
LALIHHCSTSPCSRHGKGTRSRREALLIDFHPFARSLY